MKIQIRGKRHVRVFLSESIVTQLLSDRRCAACGRLEPCESRTRTSWGLWAGWSRVTAAMFRMRKIIMNRLAPLILAPIITTDNYFPTLIIDFVLFFVCLFFWRGGVWLTAIISILFIPINS